jgi:ABC-2 type transport system ATP-binding protein
MPPADPVVISVRDLRRSYGNVEAVRGVSFDVNRGEVFGLLGPNGAGKTTILETIEGLRPVQSGQVSVAREPRRVSRMIGVQLQHVAFFDRLTLDELLRLFADLYEGPARPEELLELVGLTRQRRMYARQLSGGQRQRLSIAVALVNEPVAMLLDEPTSGLDPQARHTVWELVRRLRERELAVVLTTHYIEEAEALCDRVAILDEGRLIALDEPGQMVRALIESGFRPGGRAIAGEPGGRLPQPDGPSDKGRVVMVRWRPYRALTLAILKASLRNPVASFGFFAALMLVLGGVKYLDSPHLSGPNLALADEAGTPASRQVVDALRRTSTRQRARATKRPRWSERLSTASIGRLRALPRPLLLPPRSKTQASASPTCSCPASSGSTSSRPV